MFGEDLSDINLFRRARRQDGRAYVVLLRRYDADLRRVASRLLAEPEQVDAVLQRAYTKAWRSVGLARVGGAKGDSVANWLYRMVYNACVDELRRQSRLPGPGSPVGPRVRLPQASEERRWAALRALGPTERLALVLVDGEGFDVAAAARILQRTPRQVAVDLDRARCRWRDLVIGPPDPSHVEEKSTDEPDMAVLPAGEDMPPAVEPEPEPETQTEGQDEPVTVSVGGGADVDVEGNGAEENDGSGSGGKAKAPTVRRSPEISAPDDLVPAAEGAFDQERFTRLKQWFRNPAS